LAGAHTGIIVSFFILILCCYIIVILIPLFIACVHKSHDFEHVLFFFFRSTAVMRKRLGAAGAAKRTAAAARQQQQQQLDEQQRDAHNAIGGGDRSAFNANAAVDVDGDDECVYVYDGGASVQRRAMQALAAADDDDDDSAGNGNNNKRRARAYNASKSLLAVDKGTLTACLNVCVIALSLVMSGTGDLATLRLFRRLRTHVFVDKDCVYGQHQVSFSKLNSCIY
jgi:hypothetical protein